MNRIAIAFLTKDRVELSKRTVEPLLQPYKFDLWWMDGSTTPAGENLPRAYARPSEYPHTIKTPFGCYAGVRGGPDAAIVYALTTMLGVRRTPSGYPPVDADHMSPAYDYVGICENDVLLHPDWFGPTFALFERGRAEGLEVGAVSPRCYEDRVLIQRDGFAAVHNLGAGFVIFTRQAARLILDNYRTGFSTENRKLFTQLCGFDIGRWWAFREAQQWLTADWHFDVILARNGLASLALTPSPVEMIGQERPLAEMGLKLVERSVELLRNDDAFDRYCRSTAEIRAGLWQPAVPTSRFHTLNQEVIFPHQVGSTGGRYDDALPDHRWAFKWSQGLGPFAYVAREGATVTLPLFGGGAFMVSNGKCRIEDEAIVDEPTVGDSVMLVTIPSRCAYLPVTLTALSDGLTLHGVAMTESQPVVPGWTFDHESLPPVE